MKKILHNVARRVLEARNKYLSAFDRYNKILESESSTNDDFPISDDDLWTAIESYLDEYVRHEEHWYEIVDPQNRYAFEFDDIEINRDSSAGHYFNVTIKGRVDWKEPYVTRESNDRGTRHWTVTYQNFQLVVLSATAMDESGQTIDITDRVKALYPNSIFGFMDVDGVPSESDEETRADIAADEKIERRRMDDEGY